MHKEITVLDSTLRDGAQGEGISFSVRDKLNITLALDSLGIGYIEAGNPFSNPKDLEFFKEVKALKLKNARLAAFGSTRRCGTSAEEDKNVQSLLFADTPVTVIFGKSWDFHVSEILRTTPAENLDMIGETVKYLKSKGKEVIYDAEHFFDGYKNNAEYALKSIIRAAECGADVICLCDTNGGCLPDEIYEIVSETVKNVPAGIGIHTHDDCGMAAANTVMAVKAGAKHIQGTFVGFGERCGNANLSTVIPTLQLKRGYSVIPSCKMKNLTETAHVISETANVRLRSGMPYVGKSAFAHKAGMHVDGVTKSSHSFEHIPPETVGNTRRFLMSEVSGRGAIMEKINKIDGTVQKDSPETSRIIEKIKEMEFKGYQFEGADASFELLLRKQLGAYKPFFKLEKYKIIGEQMTGAEYQPATAVVKVAVDGVSEISAAEGNGPVNALDKALRKSLETFYPALKSFRLTDYKVRILDSRETSSAVTRVLIESGDDREVWSTVGVSRDIIEASLIAFVDAIEYKLIKDTVK